MQLEISYFLLLCPLLSSCACPDDTWTPGADQDTCYRVSSGHMGWHAAHQWCGERGGYLAEVSTIITMYHHVYHNYHHYQVNTQAEQTFIQTILR